MTDSITAHGAAQPAQPINGVCGRLAGMNVTFAFLKFSDGL